MIGNLRCSLGANLKAPHSLLFDSTGKGTAKAW